MPREINNLEKKLWDAADELRANSKLKAPEYSTPVLGLIFLRFAEKRFVEADREIQKSATGRRKIGKVDYQARGVIFQPPEARFEILRLPNGRGTPVRSRFCSGAGRLAAPTSRPEPATPSCEPL